jgi:hypothetical protein
MMSTQFLFDDFPASIGCTPQTTNYKQIWSSSPSAPSFTLSSSLNGSLVSPIVYISNAVVTGYVKEVTSPIKLVKMSKKLEDPCNYNPRQKPVCIGCVQHV